MFLHCLRSLHFLKDVSDFFRFISAVCTCLRSLHVIRCFSYVSALYTFVTYFWEICFFFFYILFMSWDGFPMYLHCIRSSPGVMGLWRHLLHTVTFLGFFESCCFFFHTYRHLLSTSVTCHGMVFLCFCIVYIRYTFWKMYLIDFFWFSSAV